MKVLIIKKSLIKHLITKALTMKKLTTVLISLTFMMLTMNVVKANPLFSLENLERERAALLVTLTSEQLSVAERYRKSESIVRRLVDIERMVLRDDRITGNANKMVKNAFAHYELTFLIHASAEVKKSPIEHWLTEFNFTTNSLLNSTVGNR